MGGGIEQTMTGELAVDLDQAVAQAAQQADADRLIVDEGARTAVDCRRRGAAPGRRATARSCPASMRSAGMIATAWKIRR